METNVSSCLQMLCGQLVSIHRSVRLIEMGKQFEKWSCLWMRAVIPFLRENNVSKFQCTFKLWMFMMKQKEQTTCPPAWQCQDPYCSANKNCSKNSSGSSFDPLHSPDLALSEYFHFPKLKEHLFGRSFSSDCDVQKAAENYINGHGCYFYRAGLNKLVLRSVKCLKISGVCIKSDWETYLLISFNISCLCLINILNTLVSFYIAISVCLDLSTSYILSFKLIR